MSTRTGKIARLPKEIRDQLNRRLEDGEKAKAILTWLNALPITQKIIAEEFGAKPVRAQNISEWKKGGYQDWLQHQQRLEWYDRLTEQDKDLDQHDNCGDTFESVGRFFIAEIGQALTSLQNIKNPNDRWTRLQSLTREFTRLQNAYNWSRHVQLKWDQSNGRFESLDNESPEEPIEGIPKPVEPANNHPTLGAPCCPPGPSRRLNSAPTSPEPQEPPTILPTEDSGLKTIDLPPTEDCELRTEESGLNTSSDQIPPTPPPPPAIPLPQHCQPMPAPAPTGPTYNKPASYYPRIRRSRFAGLEG